MSKRKAFEKKLPSNWEARGLELSQEGGTETEVYASFGLSVSEHESIKEKNPPYKEQFERWEAMSEAYYIRICRENLDNKDFNFREWGMCMREIFGWGGAPRKPKEKKDVDDTTDDDVLNSQEAELKDNLSRFRTPIGEINQPEANNG